MKISKTELWLILTVLVAFAFTASAQTTEIAYQGSLQNAGMPANGNHDFEFRLYDAPTGDVQIGPAVSRTNTAVSNGSFSVNLDFGSVFTGADLLLEIRVRPSEGGNFTILQPRNRVRSSPHAIQSLNAANAANATNAANALQLGGVAANQFVQTVDPRMTDSRDPLPGSTSYVQNTSVVQAASNFNVSGDGTVGGILRGGTVRATSGFFIGSNRILGAEGLVNLFTGINAGVNNTGNSNAFFGANAGQLNTSGSFNSFFGSSSGQVNTTGQSNSFFGTQAGNDNTSGSNNSFFGSLTGDANTTGADNSFFGTQAGSANTTGNNNSFFGRSSGLLNTVGSFNSFFGRSAGLSNVGGSSNAFFGYFAGEANTNGTRNSFFGRSAGASNVGGSDNSFFGYNAGLVNTTGFNNAFFGSEAGTANTAGEVNSFFGVAAGKANTIGNENTFVGTSAGFNNSEGLQNTFVGRSSGRANVVGQGNTYVGFESGKASTTSFNSFFGSGAGDNNTTGQRNTMLGSGANVNSGGLSYATAIGALSTVSNSNSVVLGRPGGEDTVRIPGDIKVSGLTGIDVMLVEGLAVFNQRASVNSLDILNLATGGSTALCRNSSTVVATCSSSLRYKNNIASFGIGLDVIKRLQPITFDWKDGGMHDLGLGAEDVAAIEPLLATYNKDGQVEGVKYDRIGVVLVNAVKEQQEQIEFQKKQVEELREQYRQQKLFNDALRKAVCSQGNQYNFCAEK